MQTQKLRKRREKDDEANRKNQGLMENSWKDRFTVDDKQVKKKRNN